MCTRPPVIVSSPHRSSDGRMWRLRASSSSSLRESPMSSTPACLSSDATGQKTIPIGEVPQVANLVKLSGNFLIASVMEALSEGDGGYPQGRHPRPTSVLRAVDLHALHRPGVHELWRADREREVPARGIRRAAWRKRHSPHPRCGGNASRPDAAGEPGPRPTSDADRPRRRTARLVGDRATRRE